MFVSGLRELMRKVLVNCLIHSAPPFFQGMCDSILVPALTNGVTEANAFFSQWTHLLTSGSLRTELHGGKTYASSSFYSATLCYPLLVGVYHCN